MPNLKTGIAWTDATWSPIRGCSRVSEGCRHCYAEQVAARFSGPGQPYEGLARRTSIGEARWTGQVRLVPEHLTDPLRWRRPRRIFVNSMSDLFHEGLPDEAIDRIIHTMAWASRHTYQVLTKRPERMRAYSQGLAALSPQARALRIVRASGLKITVTPEHNGGLPWPLPNVWLGVSVEDQATADSRTPLLLQTPAAVRFVSVEPCLGPIDLSQWLGGNEPHDRCREVLPGVGGDRSVLRGRPWTSLASSSVDSGEHDGGAAVLAGGETGYPCRCVGVRGLSDGDVLGWREGTPQSLRSSGRLDAASPGGHSHADAGEPQRRSAVERSARESGTDNTIRERDPRHSCAGSEACEAERSHDATDQSAGCGDPSSLCRPGDGPDQDRRDVRSFSEVGLGYPLPEDLARPSLNWVILGGESGPHARPFRVEWARSVLRQCRVAGVAAFCKQLGAYVVDRNDRFGGWEPDQWPEDLDPARVEENIHGFREEYQGADVRIRLRDRAGADPAEWPEDLRVQEFPRPRPAG